MTQLEIKSAGTLGRSSTRSQCSSPQIFALSRSPGSSARSGTLAPSSISSRPKRRSFSRPSAAPWLLLSGRQRRKRGSCTPGWTPPRPSMSLTRCWGPGRQWRGTSSTTSSNPHRRRWVYPVPGQVMGSGLSSSCCQYYAEDIMQPISPPRSKTPRPLRGSGGSTNALGRQPLSLTDSSVCTGSLSSCYSARSSQG